LRSRQMEPESTRSRDHRIEPLTRREREILVLLAGEQSNQEIADQLYVALSTVKGYTQQIYRKLGVSGRRVAVKRARQLGLLAPPATAVSQDSAQLSGRALPAGTITFLFTDIEGSTPLWERHPDQMAEALKIHNAALREAIEKNGGLIFKTIGDSFQAAFPIAIQALRAAIEGQHALQSASWNELGPLKVRMGLHTGEAELDPKGDEYTISHTKNRAARIMSAAHCGQVLLSAETAELVDHQLPEKVSLKDLGEHRLKGMALPEHLFQANAVGLLHDFPPLATSITHPNNLPIRLTSFIGREKELETVRSLLGQHRLVTLTGTGGTGKTRLCLQAAGLVLENYPNGAWLVELASLSDPGLVPQAVAGALNLPEIPGKTVLQSVEDYLRAKRLLLILDNCEHLLDACARLADRLLRVCPELTILASSREFLGVKGEASYLVPPMSLPDMRHLPPLAQLAEYDSVRLFVERARMITPEFSVEETNAPAIVQVVNRVEGIPLAIELAAARLRVLSVEQISQRLDDAFRLLTGGSRTVLPRHQTLRALIDWSYNLLDEPERILLRRLSVFSGGWSLEAAERVCADEDEDCQSVWAEDSLDLLTGLVDKSLIQTTKGVGGLNRFRMLETIRQYAGEKLAGEFLTNEKLVDESESMLVRTRHMKYYLALVEELEAKIRGREQLEVLDRLEEELDNLRLGLKWALETDVEAELRMAAALRWFWHIRSRQSEGIDWLERGFGASKVLKQGDEGIRLDPIMRARALTTLGFLLTVQLFNNQGGISTAEQARQSLEESLAIYQEADVEGDPELRRGLAWTLQSLAHLLWEENFSEYPELAQEAYRLFQEIGDAHGMAECLRLFAYNEKDPGRRTVIHQRQLAIDRANGDVEGIADGLGMIALSEFENGNYENALASLDASLGYFQQVNNLLSQGWQWLLTGAATFTVGNPEYAIHCLDQSIAIHTDLGYDSRTGMCLHWKSLFSFAEGNFDRAAELSKRAEEYAEKAVDQNLIANTWFLSARMAHLTGDVVGAREYAEKIMQITDLETVEKSLGYVELSHLALEGGYLEEASNLLREGIQLVYRAHDYNWFMILVDAAVNLAARQNQQERAALLFGARWSRGWYQLLSPQERTHRQIAMNAIKASLGESRFEQLYEEGGELTLEQVIALALETENQDGVSGP
jgi:predicted ATPase/class 3 adenylate cyclase